MKIVIVGGVAGGATAAARLRRLNEQNEIIILERGGYVSWANCGLPYYIGDVIESRDELTLQTPQSFFSRFKVDVRVNSEVVKVDAQNKTVTVKRLKEGDEYTESFDKLILSPGAKAVEPPLYGIQNPKIFKLRTVEDADKIKAFIDKQNPQNAVVIGGGFIGLEMAENLIVKGLNVALLQLENQVMPPLDLDMSGSVHNHLRQKGLNLLLESNVKGFEDMPAGVKIDYNETSITADFIILAIGVVPETHLAKDAGLKLGIKNSIAVNEYMQTSNSDIYAVGDAVEVTNFVTQTQTLIPLAGPANKQARIAADNICGIKSKFNGTQGSSIIKLFDLTVATTGINEKTAVAMGLSYDKAVIMAGSHAGYYPNAQTMTIKTLFEPTSGRILGAQIVGQSGVDKRIDVFATAIRAGMTAQDLEQLELAYAPPYSSAKDPVNMMGFVIENLLSGIVKQYHWHEIAKFDENAFVLDVRTKSEFERGHINNAVNIPLDSLRENLNAVDKNKKIYVNCQSGLRSYVACRILAQNGFDCYNLSGGYAFYSQNKDN